MGTWILQIGPGNAEIIGLKDFDFALKMLQGNPKIWNSVDTLTHHRVNQEWMRDKSSMSFTKFRKFPSQWSQKLLMFLLKFRRNKGSKMLTSPQKNKKSVMDHFYSSIKNL